MFLIFFAVGFGIAMSILFFVRALRAPSEGEALLTSRVEKVSISRNVTSLAEAELAESFFARIIIPWFNRFRERITSNSQNQYLQKMEVLVSNAGNPFNLDGAGFFAVQILMAVILFAAGILFSFILKLPLNIFILILLVCGIFSYVSPSFYLKSRIKKRKATILQTLPGALDLISIAMEAGSSFEQALERVASHYDNVLGQEFNTILSNLNYGISRDDALMAFAERTGIDETREFAKAVNQAQKLGSSLLQIISIQAGEIRRMRGQNAKIQGQKAPIKLLFITLFFMFPAIFMILLGPAAIQVMHILQHK